MQNSRRPNGRLRVTPHGRDGHIIAPSTGQMNTNNNPRTNTAVLKAEGYEFAPDIYKPRQYDQRDTGWRRKSG